jgi:hypothetical protein
LNVIKKGLSWNDRPKCYFIYYTHGEVTHDFLNLE